MPKQKISNTFLANKKDLIEMINEHPYYAGGYLLATNDFCWELSKRLQKDQPVEDMKAELQELICERFRFEKRSDSWFP